MTDLEHYDALGIDEGEPELGIDDGGEAAVPEVVAEPEPEPLALARSLPDGFDLQALLTFLPDVRLKRAQDATAVAADALIVTGADGLTAAADLRADLKAQAAQITLRFDGTRDAPGPTALAGQLHKRLTGLRADFLKRGEEAVASLDRRIVAEQRRLAAVEAEEVRQRQARADAELREAASRAAAEAARTQAPAEVVSDLQERARTATAPPVSRTAAPPRKATVASKWRARLVGTPEGAEPNPCMADLTAAQQAQVLDLMRAVIDGHAPLLAFEVDWSYLNKRAAADQSTLAVPGVEAFDEGAVRGRRKL